MLFSSLVFLWIFLPVVFLGCRVLPLRGQNALLLVASLLFYGWGEPVYLFLMLGSITLNWVGGLIIDKTSGGARKAALGAVVAANLLLLGYFKYYGFVADTIDGLLHSEVLPMRDIALPIGISFYTFQAMSYVIDLYRGHYPVQKNWFRLALYISFFPQLIAGPIVQYGQIEQQLGNRKLFSEQTAYGIKRFCWGLGKKVILANAFAAKADEIYGLAPESASTALAWLGAVYYTLQMYYDFSGYSDMAIGLGEMFGFHFAENFNYPYLSRTVSEFWRRWHISLSSWFRDYLYIPLGGNRRGKAKTLRNLFIVFLVTGLWHGANWQFVAWGIWHGMFLIIERIWLRKKLESWPAVIGHVYTLVSVMLGWVIFRAPGLRAGLVWMRAMILPTQGSAAYPVTRYLDDRTILLLAAGILLCGLAQRLWPRLKKALYDREAPGPVQSAAMLACLFGCIMLLVSSTYNPFIYFRF